MPGIGAMRNNRRTGGDGGGSRREQFWLEDSQVFLTSVASGQDDDPYMDSFWVHTFQQTDGSGSWTKVLADKDGPLRPVPEGNRPSYRFGFWAYIHNVAHATKKNEAWNEVFLADGKTKRYVEEVGDFRFCILPFGRDDQYYNDLVDVYNDWGGDLSKGVIKVTRRGAGRNTNYSIAAQSLLELTVPEDRLAKVSDLPSAWDYMMDNYGVGQSSETGDVPTTAVSIEGSQGEANENEVVEKLPWE
mgnify:FL=1